MRPSIVLAGSKPGETTMTMIDIADILRVALGDDDEDTAIAAVRVATAAGVSVEIESDDCDDEDMSVNKD